MNRLLLTFATLCGVMTAHQFSGESVRCRNVAVPVVIFAGTSGTYTVSGELCATASEQRAGKTVQVLLHGAAYNYDYWDFHRLDGVEYSYSRDVAAGGFATFAYDALGSGNSSHPPSDQLPIQSAPRSLIRSYGLSAPDP
jgi:hypothetical protein